VVGEVPGKRKGPLLDAVPHDAVAAQVAVPLVEMTERFVVRTVEVSGQWMIDLKRRMVVFPV
jgi:hypothetical protein